MKGIIIVIICGMAAALILCACVAPKPANDDENNGDNKAIGQEEPGALEEADGPGGPGGVFDSEPVREAEVVSLLIPAIFLKDTDDETIQLVAEGEGYEAFANRDGSYSFVMDVETQQRLISDYKRILDGQIESYIESKEYANIVDIICNEDYSVIDIMCTEHIIYSDSLNVLPILGMEGPNYQLYLGRGEEAKTTISVIDVNTGDVYTILEGPEEFVDWVY